MKIAIDDVDGSNRFTAYGRGFVDVNGARHRASVIVAADQVIEDWFEGPVEALSGEALEPLAAMKPDIVLLGAGSRFRFPPPGVLAPLRIAGIGVEVMDTPAACRTYNVLQAEGRRVVAALILD